jgi:hypothetical protein
MRGATLTIPMLTAMVDELGATAAVLLAEITTA